MSAKPMTKKQVKNRAQLFVARVLLNTLAGGCGLEGGEQISDEDLDRVFAEVREIAYQQWKKSGYKRPFEE